MRKEFFTTFLLGSILVPISAAAETAEADITGAYRHIEGASPRAHVIGGSFTIVFSGLSLARGATILRDENARLGERNTAYVLIAVNAVRFVDGAQRILLEPQSVTDARAFQSGSLPDPAARLAEISSHSRSVRFWRAHSILVTGLCYLALFQTGRSTYDKFDQVGGFLVGLAAFQYWKKTPEEVAARRYFGTNSADVRVFALPGGAGAMLTVNY